ncbi:hypothetical protein [Clostridium perfringens]|uniref:hypothetical protein n=1 Tax=Clostridium perfringens TaxID=1502 RepID=UPI0039E8E390
MRRIIKIQGSSHVAMRKLEEFYDDFTEIKKITTYLNQANFLLDEYPIDDTSVNMILENFNGQLVYVSGLNCGYRGTGPRTTQKLLMKIGFSEEESERLIVNEALKIEFMERANLETIVINSEPIFLVNYTGTLEEEMKRAKGIKNKLKTNIIRYYIDQNTKVDIVNRKIYIQNPQKNSLFGLLYLINLVDVNEVEYYIGNKSNLENSLRADELFRDWSNTFDYKARSVNLIIRNNKFDIICFINEESQLEVISTVYYEIFKESMLKKVYNKENFILTDNKIGIIKAIGILLKSFISTSTPDIYGKRRLE